MKVSLFGAAIVLAGMASLGGVAAQETPAPAPVPAPKAEKKITIDFKDMAIRDAMDTLFRGTGLNYALTPEAAQVAPTVTVNLQDVTFDAALNILTRTAGLRVKKDRDTGVYMIEAKTATVDATPVGGGSLEPTATPDVAPTLQIEKIPLNFVDSFDIYSVLSGQGSNRGGNSGGGFGGNSGGGFGGNSGGGFGGNSGGGFGGNSGGGFGGNSGGGFGGNSGGGFGGGGFGR